MAFSITVRDFTGVIAQITAIGEDAASAAEAVRSCFDQPVGITVCPLNPAK